MRCSVSTNNRPTSAGKIILAPFSCMSRRSQPCPACCIIPNLSGSHGLEHHQNLPLLKWPRQYQAICVAGSATSHLPSKCPCDLSVLHLLTAAPYLKVKSGSHSDRVPSSLGMGTTWLKAGQQQASAPSHDRLCCCLSLLQEQTEGRLPSSRVS